MALTRHAPSPRGQRGFTLVELIIVLVLLAILGTWGSSLIADAFRTSRMVVNTQASAVQVRYAVERLAREIREVQYIDETSGYAITSALSSPATNMVFTRTVNGADVTVTIDHSGNSLTLGYSSPAESSNVATGVTGFSLSFLKLDDTEATLTTEVRFVVINLTTTDPTSGQQVNERVRVALRNT
jgi:prepilin-type N-terminal cleavage/methylation domain-containing protein